MQRNSEIQKKFRLLSILILSCLILQACTVASKRDGAKKELPIPSTGELPPRIDISDDGYGEGSEPVIPNVKVPKIGIVLTPAGARSYSYIGVLREFEKAKVPIDSIAGLEWGALIGALYSVNGKAHEVEWKASKIPEDFVKKGILSSSVEPRSFAELDKHLKTIFENTKVEEGKIPFSCITDNLKNFKSLMIFKGTYRDTLGFCLGHAPITTSKNGWVASSQQTRLLIDQMAQRGMDYIVLVDALTPYYPLNGVKVDESVQIVWSNVHKSIAQNKKYVHQVITVPISKNILSFNSRKEFIQLGERAGKEAAEKIVKQFGL